MTKVSLEDSVTAGAHRSGLSRRNRDQHLLAAAAEASPVFTTKEAMAFLRIGHSKLYDLISENVLEVVKVGGKTLVTKASALKVATEGAK